MQRISMLAIAALLFLLLGVMQATNAQASTTGTVPVEIKKIWLCKDSSFSHCIEIDQNTSIGGIQVDETLGIIVEFLALNTSQNIEVEASIKGHEYKDGYEIRDSSELMNIEAGKYYPFIRLRLDIPEQLEPGAYALRIEISDRINKEVSVNIPITISRPRRLLKIKDIILNPENAIEAGKTLLVKLRLRNLGQLDEESIRVRVEIPELDSASPYTDWIDELRAGDALTTKELYIRIPPCAQPGYYDVNAIVTYDDGYQSISKAASIEILESALCRKNNKENSSDSSEENKEQKQNNGKTIITIGSTIQDIVAGQGGAAYPISITNNGLSSKTYTIEASGASWANIRITPNIAILEPGETKVIYVALAPRPDAPPGEQAFGIAIKAGDKLLKEIVLRANIIKPRVQEVTISSFKLNRMLEYGLIIFVVLLIIFGLIIAITRVRRPRYNTRQTYY